MTILGRLGQPGRLGRLRRAGAVDPGRVLRRRRSPLQLALGGVRLAIDDFGTGYSSLSDLRRFPIDMLKIDKAFVDGIGGGRQDATLAHAIINLSHTLELHTIAEGIELPEQAASLAALGCHDGQGYHFARPLPMEAMTELLERTLAPGGFLLAATGAVTT
jgi:EAL domain-containing protein (putative c-di-GMP-specific phosphodiesterase class I)